MKKKLSIILCIAAVLALAVFVAIKVYLVYHPGEPKVISDLCYGKKGCKDFLVYVKENGIYTPYIVIDTKNYGEDAVLLLRKDVYMQEMMYRDEDLQGIGAAYYPEDWDESEIERFNGGFRAKYSRVCMGESYAEGQLVKLHDMKIATVGIYSGFDHLDSIIIEEMEFEDGEEIYEPTHILPYAVNTEECDRT